jgi:hypothetical protein
MTLEEYARSEDDRLSGAADNFKLFEALNLGCEILTFEYADYTPPEAPLMYDHL